MPVPHVYFGVGEVNVIPRILTQHRVRKAMVVSGKSAYLHSGLEKVFTPFAEDIQFYRFANFTSNPQVEQVERLLQQIRELRCDAVVAVGGGTAIDIGKAAAALAAHEGSVLEYVHRPKSLRRDCLLVAAPTTAGTGSEATSFSVVYINGRKHSLDDPALLPDYAVVDPNLTVGLPKRVAASSAVDAICQAIESLWSVQSTEQSRCYAREALQLGLRHIKAFCQQRGPESREGMARAALLAGQAINVTRTTGPHAVSYGLTTLFGIPHGHSCALTLPAFMIYNSQVTELDVMDPRGAAWVRERIEEILGLLHADSSERGCEQFRHMMMATGLECRLSDLGLKTAEIERFMNYGFDLNRASNNPRRLTEAGFREVMAMAV